jgi:hypothetical protein
MDFEAFAVSKFVLSVPESTEVGHEFRGCCYSS